MLVRQCGPGAVLPGLRAMSRVRDPRVGRDARGGHRPRRRRGPRFLRARVLVLVPARSSAAPDDRGPGAIGSARALPLLATSAAEVSEAARAGAGAGKRTRRIRRDAPLGRLRGDRARDQPVGGRLRARDLRRPHAARAHRGPVDCARLTRRDRPHGRPRASPRSRRHHAPLPSTAEAGRDPGDPDTVLSGRQHLRADGRRERGAARNPAARRAPVSVQPALDPRALHPARRASHRLRARALRPIRYVPDGRAGCRSSGARPPRTGRR